MEIKLAFIGFGNVGRALARLLLRKRQELAQDFDLRCKAVAIATARHGSALNPEGLDLEAALELADSGETLRTLSRDTPPATSLEMIRACEADVLFENTPVNYGSGQPALEHLRAALEAGMHAITANKGPVVHGYRELSRLASDRGLRFLFEATVMDGAPVFSVWREALPAARLRAFRGVLNSTTNMILTQMEHDSSFEEAVAHAQEIGIAETDPSGDVDGWDAAIKVAALVTVLMQVPLTPQEVERTGIRDLTTGEIREAADAGQRWKLICSAERQGETVRAHVRPERIPGNDSLYHVNGTSCALTLHTDVLGDLTLTESDPGPHTTAYGLFADFLNAVRGSV